MPNKLVSTIPKCFQQYVKSEWFLCTAHVKPVQNFPAIPLQHNQNTQEWKIHVPVLL